MNNNRCPWCGKKANFTRVPKKDNVLLPRFSRFQRCNHCGKLCGQNPYIDTAVHILFYALVPTIVATFFFRYAAVAWAVAATIIYCTLPLTRINEKGLHAPYDRSLEVVAKPSEGVKIKKGLYFLMPDFDEYDAYVALSPIIFDKIDRKNGIIYGYYLYDNRPHGSTELSLYDRNMSLVGTATLLNCK